MKPRIKRKIQWSAVQAHCITVPEFKQKKIHNLFNKIKLKRRIKAHTARRKKKKWESNKFMTPDLMPVQVRNFNSVVA